MWQKSTVFLLHTSLHWELGICCPFSVGPSKSRPPPLLLPSSFSVFPPLPLGHFPTRPPGGVLAGDYYSLPCCLFIPHVFCATPLLLFCFSTIFPIYPNVLACTYTYICIYTYIYNNDWWGQNKRAHIYIYIYPHQSLFVCPAIHLFGVSLFVQVLSCHRLMLWFIRPMSYTHLTAILSISTSPSP